MGSFRVKGPRTYRNEYPGEHVLVMMWVSPGKEETEVIIEGPVDKEFAQKAFDQRVEHMRERAERKRKAG